eukprot:1159469-Pelagomonas_calceolata.AAC.9
MLVARGHSKCMSAAKGCSKWVSAEQATWFAGVPLACGLCEAHDDAQDEQHTLKGFLRLEEPRLMWVGPSWKMMACSYTGKRQGPSGGQSGGHFHSSCMDVKQATYHVLPIPRACASCMAATSSIAVAFAVAVTFAACVHIWAGAA